MTQALLDLVDIEKHYNSGDNVVRALDGVSLQIYPGEFIAIMGQSGSGKSTLMNIIGCLDQPSGGSYKIKGVEASSLQPDELASLRRETFGFVFQRYNLLATASAEENVEIPAVYAGLSKPQRVSRAKELLKRLGLGDRGDHRPSQLSGGQQQRVAIARALMNDPPVILADEPTGALDSKSGVEVMNLLKELHQEGRTIILITHDEKVAENAERVIRISDGKIIDNQPPKITAQKLEQHESEGEGEESLLIPDITEATKMAMRSLRVNIFRTSLTLLGIIIGVAAVVTMLAVGQGSKQKILDQISAMGTNTLSIRPGQAGFRGAGDIVTLIPEDAEAIQTLANVEATAPQRNGRFTLRYGNTDYASSVTGTGPQFPAINNWALTEGSFFTDLDMKSYAPVIVLGQTVVKNLFPDGESPIGKYVLVKNVSFLVIGVLEPKGASFGGDQDDSAYVPITTGMIRLFGKSYLSNISVRIIDINHMDETQEEITKLLTERHRKEDFNIRNMTSLLETVTATQDTLTYMLGAVAAISLLVGGIGVMNIMLVSVTERTREIGIRMATGARRRDILLQFNTEAAVVCAIGGILGVILGIVAGMIVEAFGMNVIFTLMPAVLAFTCAFGTGLLFGYLPARKAAHLDPVIALASE